MKSTTILYLVLLFGILAWLLNSSQILDSKMEGYENISEPKIPKGLTPTVTDTEAMPNPNIPNQLPFGPYAQMASVGSFQYQDPSTMSAELTQMKKINEDLRSFLAFEGVHLTNSSDPTVSLPLTQLRADSRKLQDEISVLDKNPGVQSQLTQQTLADIEGSLVFLQKKVRLFETSGVVSDNSEGFRNMHNKNTKHDTKATGKASKEENKASETTKKDEKTKATKKDLQELQTKAYAAILKLSASGTTDPVVQARIKRLQKMYSDLDDMIKKLNKGQWTEKDIPVFKEDINEILPNLDQPSKEIKDVFSQTSGKKLNRIEKQLAYLVGVENAQDVFNELKKNGSFRVSMDLGYHTKDEKEKYKKNNNKISLQKDYSINDDGMHPHVSNKGMNSRSQMENNNLDMDTAFDSHSLGMDDNAIANSKSSEASHFDWKKRATTICEQVKLRGLDPLDFGCLPKDSLMSPAYSWRGYTKMVCGRLGTTMDPDLPVVCGCPPQRWKGWSSP